MDTSVIDLPAPVAARLRRPGWRDPRLLAGVAMVAASVLLGSWAVRTAQATVPVYVTRAALVPGRPRRRPRTSRSSTSGSARSTSTTTCVPTGRSPADGVAVRAVGRGELVPASAVGLVAPTSTCGPSSVTLDARAVAATWCPARSWTCGSRRRAPTEDAEPTEPQRAGRRSHGRRGEHAVGSLRRVGRERGPGAGPAARCCPSILTALAAEGTVDVVPVLGTGG